MKRIIIEFTYKGRKHTYLRRFDNLGTPLTTTNIKSAKKIKPKHIENTIKQLLIKLGKDNVNDIKPIEEDEG